MSTIRGVTYEQEFVDETGLLTLINNANKNIEKQLKTAAEGVTPKMSAIMGYNASSTDTSYSGISSTYDILFLCVLPALGETQIFLTVPVKNLTKGSSMYVAAPDNTYTTRYKVERVQDGSIKIEAVACYKENVENYTGGYGTIKGIYGMTIGG